MQAKKFFANDALSNVLDKVVDKRWLGGAVIAGCAAAIGMALTKR
jgi:hypothetical protein